MNFKITFCLLLVVNFLHSQFKVSNNEIFSVANDELLYINDALLNEGTIALNSSRILIGSDFNNTSGTLNSADATFELVGGSNQNFTFANNDVVKRFELNKSSNTATVLAGKLSITDVLKSLSGTLDAGEKIILVSTNLKTAIVEPSSGGTIDNIVVERYIPAKRAFRLISSPVTSSTSINYNWQGNQNNTSALYANNFNSTPGYGTHIAGSTTGVNGFDATQSGNPSLFTFDNSTQSWSAIANTNTNTFSVGNPYRLMVRGDRSIDMNTNTPVATNTILRTSGSLKIGTHTANNLSSIENEFNFIGNPYQSPIDIETVINNSTNINPNYYYVWDPQVGGANGRGAYVAYSFFLDTNNVAGSAVNAYLQPMQACFVKTASNGASSVVFQENNKFTTTNEAVYRNANTQHPIIKLNLFDALSFNQGNTALDGVLCVFGSSFSNGLDAYDAEKLTNLDENLAILVQNNKQSIASYDTPDLTTVYPLHVANYTKEDYVFTANVSHYNGLTPYLYDKFLTTYTEINDNMTYPFSVEPSNLQSTATNRFDIVFSNSMLDLSDEMLQQLVNVYPNPATTGMFTCSVPQQEGEISIVVHNELGQKIDINQISIGNNSIQCTVTSPIALGVYHIIITLNNGTTVVKKWVVN